MPTSSTISTFAPSIVPSVSAPFNINFIFPVPLASLLAVEILVDQLVDGTYDHDRELFRSLYNSLLNTQSTDKADRYFILKDFRAYAEAQKQVEKAYKNTTGWAKSANKIRCPCAIE